MRNDVGTHKLDMSQTPEGQIANKLNPVLGVDMLDEGTVSYRCLYYLSRALTQGIDYESRYQTFTHGSAVNPNEGGEVKSSINFFYRYCKTHASYVVKDEPNINVPAQYPDQTEDRIHSANIEKFLTMWWKEQSFTKKIKVGALRGAIFGDMYFLLNIDKKTQEVSVELIDPSEMIYDTIDSNINSPVKIAMRIRLEDTKLLQRTYPQFANRIFPSTYANQLINMNYFTKSALYSFDKSMVIYLMDNKYIYTSINGTLLIDTKEHGYDKIPLYHWKYIDIGDKYGKSLVDLLYEPIKYMQLALSYILSNAYDFSVSPLVSDAATPQMAGQKGFVRGLVTLPKGSTMQYLNPPQSNMDLYKIIDFAKQFMSFVSGISDEAMAGFTGSLTSSGVAVELRLDSTVRETLDCQVTLQDLLQRINADVLKMYEKYFPKKDLFNFKTYGNIHKALPFTSNMISGKYNNIVDFGGILPRADAQLVQSVLSKFKMGLISQDTALEELRYMDPTLEMTKILKEQVDKTKLAQALRDGTEGTQTGFDGPKDENLYMLTENKSAPVLPSQNHQEHYMVHAQAFDKTKNQAILMHMQLHQQLMKQGGGLQVQSQEGQQQQVNKYYNQGQGGQPQQNQPQ